MRKIVSKKIIFSTLVVAFGLYSVLVYTKGTASDLQMSAAAKRGKLLWQEYNCTACHQIYGLGGYLGPDLTDVTSTKGPEYAKAMMRSGIYQMPLFDMSPDESDDLVAFLTHVDKTGNFPARTAEMTWYGSYMIRPSGK